LRGIIGIEVAIKLKAMVGFRSIAVHDYQEINVGILKEIIEKHLNDLKEFKNLVLDM
jgi:uncharacterized protein YutE (UPF0331/DUF86 family)